MGDATAHKRSGDAMGESAQVAQREEAAVALTQRDPADPAKLGQTKVLEITDNRVGEETLEVIRLKSGRIDAAGERLFAQLIHAMAVHSRRASRTTLVRKHDTEMLDRLGEPPVRMGVEHARARAAGAALKVHDRGKFPADVLGKTGRAVKETDLLARKRGVRLKASGFSAKPRGVGVVGPGKKRRARAPPVERDIDGVILDIQAGEVIRGEKSHGAFLSQ